MVEELIKYLNEELYDVTRYFKEKENRKQILLKLNEDII